MWFKELVELWRTNNSLALALDDSTRMMEQTLVMFRESVRSLRESDTGELKINVYEMDQMVNRYIREVRRKVLKYLVVTGGMNMVPGLILITIIIDIERIGDYTKNIMDLARFHHRKLDGGPFEADFKKITDSVAEMYIKLIEIHKKSDKAAASALMKDNFWVLKKCDEIVEKLVKDEESTMKPDDAASLALFARYLKRIAAHLHNIASSVVSPFEHVGFKSEDG